jgi:outer membrane receptor protein involved in Fe transport
MRNIRKLPYLILLLSLGNSLLAQPVLKGVVAGWDNKPVEGATLQLLRLPDSSLAAGTASDNTGLYTFSGLKPGTYVLKASSTGYRNYISPVFELKPGLPEKITDTIYLDRQAASLQSVSVSGRKNQVTVQPDRTVLNVANSIATAGGTALEMIAASPGITVNYLEGTISMNGKKGVVVMINGRPNYMPAGDVVKMLQGLGSGNIQKIEFITSPPAGFDAEGNAGFINIVLKKNPADGLNGSFSAMGGYGKGLLASGSGNFNYRSNRINLFGDASYTYTRNKPYTTFYRRVFDQGVLKENYSITDRTVRVPNINGRLGLDIELSPKTTTGLLVSAYDNQFRMQAINTAFISSKGNLDTVISINNREVNRWKNYSANFNIHHTIDKKTELVFNADYIYYKNSDPVNYTNDYYNNSHSLLNEERIQTTKETPIRFKVAALDISSRLDSTTVLNVGAKTTFLTFDNNIGFNRLKQNIWERDSALSAVHALREDYSAAYVSLSAKPAKNINLRLGVRYEYTNSNLSSAQQKDLIDRHYGNLFPSMLVSYKVSEQLTWSASYNRRITRPTFNDLAPFTYYQDPNTFLTGNPALQPALSGTVKTDLQFRKYFLSVGYTTEKSAIQLYQPRIDSTTNKLFYSSENIDRLKTVNASLTAPVEFSNWLSGTYTIGFIRQQADLLYEGSAVKRNKTIWSFNGSQRADLGKNWAVELSGFFRSGDIIGILIQKPYGSLDAGVRKQWGSKGTIGLSLSNVLNSMQIRFLADEAGKNLYTTMDANLFYRTLRLTYTLSFGNQQVKAKRSRSTGAEEEKSRVN